MAFAIPTVSDLQTIVWDTIVDTDSNNRAFDATTLLRIMNKLYAQMKGLSDDRVYDLNATASGMSFPAGTRSITTTPINIRRILQVYPTSGASSVTPGGKGLSRVEPWELQRMQIEEATTLEDMIPALTFAQVFACWRAGTETHASVGKWVIGLWRLPLTTTRTYMLRVLQEPILLDASTVTTPDLPVFGCYALADMTAAVGARLIGRSEEEIADIKARVPEEFGAVLRAVETELGLVRGRPQEQPA